MNNIIPILLFIMSTLCMIQEYLQTRRIKASTERLRVTWYANIRGEVSDEELRRVIREIEHENHLHS